MSIQAACRTGKAALGVARQFLLVALIGALALLALHPFCDLSLGTAAGESAALQIAAGGTHPESVPPAACCASLHDGTVVKSADPLIAWMPIGAIGVMADAFAALRAAAGQRVAARSTLVFFPKLSFYARSARILR